MRLMRRTPNLAQRWTKELAARALIAGLLSASLLGCPAELRGEQSTRPSDPNLPKGVTKDIVKVQLLCEELKELEDSTMFTSGVGIVDRHRRRIELFGELLILSSHSGEAAGDVEKKAEAAFNLAKRELPQLSSLGTIGLSSLAVACFEQNQLDNAIKWQKRVVSARDERQIAQGFGLLSLARAYHAADQSRLARDALDEYLQAADLRPVERLRAAEYFVEFNDIERAKNVLEESVALYDGAARTAGRKLRDKRVLVDPAKCREFAREFWFDFGNPILISESQSDQLSTLKEQGFIDITDETIAAKKQSALDDSIEMRRLRDQAIKALQRLSGSQKANPLKSY